MKPFYKTVLQTWLLAGTLDILSAYVHLFIRTNEISKTLFHYIAGGALGLENAMQGGWGVVLLGIFFHYFIAFAFTLFFFLIYQRLNLYSMNKYVVGLLYGLFVWFIMNVVILPLTKLPPRPFNPENALINALILMVLVGLPISISAHHYFRKVRA